MRARTIHPEGEHVRENVRHATKCTGKKKNWKQQEKISVFRLLAIGDCEASQSPN